MADLPTNYFDDILSESMNGKKKFRLTYRNGTTEEVTIEDISEYDQYGSKFGAGDINKTNQAVNEKLDSGDVVDPMLTTEPGFAADAYHTKMQFDELNSNLGGFTPVIDETGKITGYKTSAGGADTVFPFKSDDIKGTGYDLIHNFSEELWPTRSGTMNTAMFRGTFSGKTKLIDVSNYNTIRVRGTIRDYTGFYPSGSINISPDNGSTWLEVYKYSSSNKNKYWDIPYDISAYDSLIVKVAANQDNNCTCIYSSIALCNE